MRMKTFLVGVWLGEGREKNWEGPSIFSLDSAKYFLFKIERKLSGRNLIDK